MVQTYEKRLDCHAESAPKPSVLSHFGAAITPFECENYPYRRKNGFCF